MLHFYKTLCYFTVPGLPFLSLKIHMAGQLSTWGEGPGGGDEGQGEEGDRKEDK